MQVYDPDCQIVGEYLVLQSILDIRSTGLLAELPDGSTTRFWLLVKYTAKSSPEWVPLRWALRKYKEQVQEFLANEYLRHLLYDE